MKIFSLAVMTLLISCSPEGRFDASGAYSFPPEWYPHEAVWIDWTDLDVNDAKIEIIKALHKDVKIYVLTHADSLEDQAVAMMLKAGIDTAQVRLYQHPVPNYFLRDSGPKYLVGDKDLMLADFAWNCYGFADYGEDCYQRGATMKDLASDFGIKTIATDVATEGGALEVNESVILAFREMATSRNPGKPIHEIEQAILKIYGKQKMIWIDQMPLLDVSGHKTGNYFGFGANGHIDEYMRFVNDSTILVGLIDSAEASSNPIHMIEAARLQANLDQIRQATNSDGRPFTIITVPMPDVTFYAREEILSTEAKEHHAGWYKNFHAGDTIIQVPIMSYLNFLITNNNVLISRYWQEGIPLRERQKDTEVLNLFRKLFPERKIVQIDPLALNWWGGGIHCSTQQVPSVSKRTIR